MGYLNIDGLTHLWSKVKGLSDLKIKKTDVVTNEEIDGMFEISAPVVPPVVEVYFDGGTSSLRITNIQEGYEYYYTLNTNTSTTKIPNAPSDPTKESILYTEPIIINIKGSPGRYYGYYIKVIAYAGSESSDIVELYDVGGGGGIGN